jgi:hypothetical protein
MTVQVCIYILSSQMMVVRRLLMLLVQLQPVKLQVSILAIELIILKETTLVLMAILGVNSKVTMVTVMNIYTRQHHRSSPQFFLLLMIAQLQQLMDMCYQDGQQILSLQHSQTAICGWLGV